MISQPMLFDDPIAKLCAAIVDAGGAPLSLLGPGDVVLVQHRERMSVRSCASNEGWYFVEVTRTITSARLAPYAPRKGEKLVPEPHESILHAALTAINERRLHEQLAALLEPSYVRAARASQHPGVAEPPRRRRQNRRRGPADQPAA